MMEFPLTFLLVLMPYLALGNVLYQIPRDSPSSLLQDSSSNKDAASDTIYEVNSETAELMDVNSTRDLRKLFEMDIRLHSRSHAIVFGADPRIQFGAHASTSALWPGGIVPYTLSSSITSEPGGITFSILQKAIAEFKAKTCIKFLPRSTETDYVHFFKETGCWSMVGRVGGKQQISLGSGCEQKGVIVHEMMHALGFWHEQSRPDRDNHIRVITDNIMDGREDQFTKYGKREVNSLGFKYDYASIMHYGPKAFSKNGRDTIAILDPNYKGVLGQRNGLSSVDVQQLNTLYKCSISPVNGAWGVWSDWLACSKQCGNGTQMRTRSCDNPPPSNGGQACKDSNIERRPCNSQPCSLDCNFNNGFCMWQNSRSDVFDWTRTSVQTPSKTTGPDISMRQSSDFYVFIETSAPRVKDDIAILTSPQIAMASSDRCIRFQYSMYGASIGTLQVAMVNPTETMLWKLSGQQGKDWKTATIPIQANTKDFKILISAIRGASYTGDIAIDNIELDPKPCSLSPQIASPNPKAPATTKQPITVATTVAALTTNSQIVTTPKANKVDCSFEIQCNWFNTGGDDFDWLIGQKSTPTSNTGPSFDHTLGNAFGSYVYIETSKPRILSESARLVSDPISTSKVTCLQFYYHMNGNSIGSLNIIVVLQNGQEIKVWELSSQQGNQWLQASVPLPANSGFRVLFEATVGNSVFGDIAIDDISWSDQSCSLKPNSARPNTVIATTAAPAPTTVPSGSVLVEVTSEGCDDPIVRQRTLAAATSNSRVKRSPSLKKFFGHLKKAVKSAAKNLKNKFGKLKRKLLGKDDDDSKSHAATIQNDCTLARSSIKINGKEFSDRRPGHTIVAINGKTGQPFQRGNFNTDVSQYAGNGIAKMINHLPDDTIIAIATQSSGSASYLAIKELQSIGAVAPYYPAGKGSWALIGYKGKNSVNWIQQESKAAGRGPTQVSAVIPVTLQPKAIQKLNIADSKVFDGQTYLPIGVQFNSLFDLGQSDFTLMAWIKTQSDGTLFSKVGSLDTFDTKSKYIFIEKGLIKVQLGGSTIYSATDKVTDNRWHFVAIVVKGKAAPNSLDIHIDARYHTANSFTAIPDQTGYLGRVGYGTRYYPGSSVFVGEMKSVSYSNTALSPTEVNEYRKNNAPILG